MKTLQQFENELREVPASAAWYIGDLGEARGKQELFTRQSQQRLKVLRQHALIESAVSSNRIEGVTVDQDRVKAVILGRSALHDRDEEEIRGYRNALKWIHEKKPMITEKTIKELHHLARGKIGDAGQYKTKDSDIIERHTDGTYTVRFKTASAKETSKNMKELVSLWQDHLKNKAIHPLVILAGFNLDFLCVHPLRDGNGRVSRLLLLLQLYHLGYEVGRYISLERLIEENKERYYETLKLSSQGWHEGKHDPWHYINFLLFILKEAYKEFEKRAGQIKEPKGAKTELIEAAIRSLGNGFTVSDLEKSCPTVSRDMIRRVLHNLKKAKKVECLARGPGATWKQKG
ncbi:MAG: cell filamentation protein Fic [Deltaproteobacteria bacterium RIFCSPLOWO2_02_FULL_44_10]|nr:MAG: cell filamentation protein Fic [Deltaproteobacteria bacterium RIFCSPHIGHO2_02_FULL_44_16]OGQ47205.1 MAG: cell filamentation protein Fic [Deltaproteobacteria bacterium RIFCSPLOWO2_02_FULL_44_10]